MKKIHLNFVLLFLLSLGFENTGAQNYTWLISCSNVTMVGIYGTQGLPALANTPGAHGYSSWWVNSSDGFLWLFGGLGLTGTPTPIESMNDLWRFKLPCNPDSVKTLQTPTLCSGGL